MSDDLNVINVAKRRSAAGTFGESTASITSSRRLASHGLSGSANRVVPSATQPK
jgi:hypothetical protein